MEYTVEYWKNFDKMRTTTEPSSFAKFCLSYIKNDGEILDVCCGNGRDTLFFKKNNLSTYSFDIEDLNLCDKKYRFALPPQKSFEYVYCRFVLHCIAEDIEDYVLINANNILVSDGLFFIEARSDKGDMPPDTNHYRRLINMDVLTDKLINLGFNILFKVETDNLSIYNEENPVLIRIVAQKTENIRIKNARSFDEIYSEDKVLNIESSKYLLLNVKKVLEANNIPFFLVFGTLLGAYRDNNFIEYDNDVDIALFRDDLSGAWNLINEGYFVPYNIRLIREFPPEGYSLNYKEDYLDMYFFSKVDNLYVCYSYSIDVHQLDGNKSDIAFLGTNFKTVNNIEAYLEKRYTKEWRVPQRHFHTLC